MTGSDTGRRAQLAAALERVEARVQAACRAAGRPRGDVTLVAVTKTRPASDVALLAELGVRDVGESKAQEAESKVAETGRPELRWHMVGRLQRNKARSVAGWAAVVHSLDRAPLVVALSRAAVRAQRELDVFVQVSLDADPARGGAPAGDVPALVDAVAAADGLVLRGLMAVPPLGTAPGPAYAELAVLAERLRAAHPDATQLSAGMSDDLEAAVAAGSTHLRIGTALLGHRAPLPR
ncbi:MAG TPA: YggS family pyridoxal phosphate-dependent enzyme [Mycobacteriales bacterium]|nr:YggS family pyridoxal phosphate-dependent enzyme [Mycobacteriales bacterium]